MYSLSEQQSIRAEPRSDSRVVSPVKDLFEAGEYVYYHSGKKSARVLCLQGRLLVTPTDKKPEIQLQASEYLDLEGAGFFLIQGAPKGVFQFFVE